MRKQLTSVVKDFARDERGASLLEYSVLLAMISIVVIATIGLVGNWVEGRWTALLDALNAND
jgi:pilus assembly protein Flp/PilA